MKKNQLYFDFFFFILSLKIFFNHDEINIKILIKFILMNQFKKTALLIVDHGSKKKKANKMLDSLGKMVQKKCKDIFVVCAHMELAYPNIQESFTLCAKAKVDFIKVHPYMLSFGRHVQEDIPRLVKQAALKYPNIVYEITPPLGLHEKIVDVILQRAKI